MSPLYFKTKFRCQSLPDSWPGQFAILTAFATTGHRWTDSQNQAANRRLLEDLAQIDCWLHPITGYDPDSDHAEPSWAVAIDFDMACDLGGNYSQVAIFYVRENDLFVSYCDPDSRDPIYIRGFTYELQES